MKAVHTEEYFKKYEDHLFGKYERQCNFEHSLSKRVPDLSAADLTEEQKETARKAVEKIEAEKIAKEATKKLIEKRHMIEDIKAGRAGLGYAVKNQEVSAMHDLVEGFEFSCYMLAQFKKKHGIK